MTDNDKTGTGKPGISGLMSLAKSIRADRSREISESGDGYLAGGDMPAPRDAVDPAYLDFKHHPLMENIRLARSFADTYGIAVPFFRELDSTDGARAVIQKRDYINFSSYNYLGLNRNPVISRHVYEAAKLYGTSVGASRLVAGERSFHRNLEKELAGIYSADDALVFVSGHATNVSTISTLFGKGDLIVYDCLSHNSIIEGIKLSGAQYFPYAHNSLTALCQILDKNRSRFKRTLLVTEGLFSMDGDIADLPELIKIKKRYGCFLMIDEAHSLGVLGEHGRGLFEHFGCDPRDVDIWMGTLSKTLAGCGGYIAASGEITDILRYYAPGFVYSVGISPVMAYSVLTALDLMRSENWRVGKVQRNSAKFLKLLKDAGINTGHARGYAVIPVITGSSRIAVQLSGDLFEEGISVHPIIHPAVSEQEARLRFFITADHTDADLERTAEVLAGLCRKYGIIKV